MCMDNERKIDLDPEDVAKGVVFDAEVSKDSAQAPQELEAAKVDLETEDVSTEMIPLDEYKQILDEHFQNLRNLIKYTKTKDETIQKLSNELQKYREDYCAKTFKSIATLLISYREDCRHSLADIETFDLPLDKAKKYLSYLCDDFEEMLSNAGCEFDDDVWHFNGKPLKNSVAPIHFPELFQVAPVEDDTNNVVCGDNMKEYLQNTENAIQKILSNNEMLEKCLRDYCTLSVSIESDIVMLCVYPPVKKMISLFESVKKRVDSSNEFSDDESMKNYYRDSLEYLINQIEDILLGGGVRIEATIEDLFDVKKNRLVKAIVTDDASLDRKIAKQYTECYLMNDTVIYPAKVDVYKYQATQA